MKQAARLFGVAGKRIMTAKRNLLETCSAIAFLTLLSGNALAQSAPAGKSDPYNAAGMIGALIGGIAGAFFLVRSFRKKK